MNYWCYAAYVFFSCQLRTYAVALLCRKNSAARRFLRAAARLSTKCEGGIMQRREPFFIPYNACYTTEGHGRQGASDLPTRPEGK